MKTLYKSISDSFLMTQESTSDRRRMSSILGTDAEIEKDLSERTSPIEFSKKYKVRDFEDAVVDFCNFYKIKDSIAQSRVHTIFGILEIENSGNTNFAFAKDKNLDEKLLIVLKDFDITDLENTKDKYVKVNIFLSMQGDYRLWDSTFETWGNVNTKSITHPEFLP